MCNFKGNKKEMYENKVQLNLGLMKRCLEKDERFQKKKTCNYNSKEQLYEKTKNKHYRKNNNKKWMLSIYEFMFCYGRYFLSCTNT